MTQEEAAKKKARLKQVVDVLLRTEEGREFWAHLFNRCGYNRTSLSIRPGGEVLPLTTECQEAQRLIYVELRALPTYELLQTAEELAERPARTPSEEKK